MKLECDLWEIFVLVCFFFFWRPGDHAKTLCSVPHIHFRRHWNQSIVLVNLDVKNGPKNIVLSWALFTLYWIAFFFAAPQPFLCVNRSPICYDFLGGAKAIQYSINIVLAYLWAYKIQKSCVCYILCSVSVWSDLGWFCDLFVTCTLFIITGYTYFWQARRM